MNIYRPSIQSSWIDETIKLLDDQIVSLYQNPEHGPILLSWMIMCMTSPRVQEDDDNILKYQQFGDRAAQLGVFNYLRTITRHPMYGDRYSVIGRLVRKAVYNILNELCDLFDGDGSVARHKYIFELLTELLRTPSIARDFIARNGEQRIVTLGMRKFEFSFLFHRRMCFSVQYRLQQFSGGFYFIVNDS